MERFGIILLGTNHTVANRLLLLLEHILEYELPPSAASCVHQPSALVQLSQLDGCEPELFSQVRHGSDRVFIVARQKDDPMTTLDDRIGRQGGCNQVIEPFHDLRAGEWTSRRRRRTGDHPSLQAELQTRSSRR